MKPKSTCYECTDRHLGCHSQCEKYKVFRAELDAIKEAKWQNRSPRSEEYIKRVTNYYYKRRRPVIN